MDTHCGLTPTEFRSTATDYAALYHTSQAAAESGVAYSEDTQCRPENTARLALSAHAHRAVSVFVPVHILTCS